MIIRGLNAPDLTSRGKSVFALSAIADKDPKNPQLLKAASAIAKVLLDNDLRWKAAFTLSKIAESNPGNLEILRLVPKVTKYMIENDLETRQSASMVFSSIVAQNPKAMEDARVVLALVRAMKDEDIGIRRIAVDAVMSIDARSVVPACICAIDDRDAEVRLSAVKVLSKFKDPSSVPALIKRVKDKDGRVRMESVLMLGQLGSAAALPALIEAIKDQDIRIGDMACECILDIIRKDPKDPLLAKSILPLAALYDKTKSRKKVLSAVHKLKVNAALERIIRSRDKTGPDALDGIDAIIDSMKTRKGNVWENMNNEIALLRSYGAPAVPHLIAVFHEKNKRQQVGILSALNNPEFVLDNPGFVKAIPLLANIIQNAGIPYKNHKYYSYEIALDLFNKVARHNPDSLELRDAARVFMRSLNFRKEEWLSGIASIANSNPKIPELLDALPYLAQSLVGITPDRKIHVEEMKKIITAHQGNPALSKTVLILVKAEDRLSRRIRTSEKERSIHELLVLIGELAVPELVKILRHKKNRMQLWAENVLKDVGIGISAVPALVQCLAEGNESARRIINNIFQKCNTIDQLEEFENNLDTGIKLLDKVKDNVLNPVSDGVFLSSLKNEAVRKKNALLDEKGILLDDKIKPPNPRKGVYQALKPIPNRS